MEVGRAGVMSEYEWDCAHARGMLILGPIGWAQSRGWYSDAVKQQIMRAKLVRS